jgi:hypothetical protein
MLVAFGPVILQGQSLSDEAYVALWLNLPRVLNQHAWSTHEGIKLALSRSGPPFPFADSATRTAVEAEHLTHNLYVQRTIADKLSGDGW